MLLCIGIAAVILSTLTGMAMLIWAAAIYRRAAPIQHPAEIQIKRMVDSLNDRMDDMGNQRYAVGTTGKPPEHQVRHSVDVLESMRNRTIGNEKQAPVRHYKRQQDPANRQNKPSVKDVSNTLSKVIDTEESILPKISVKDKK